MGKLIIKLLLFCFLITIFFKANCQVLGGTADESSFDMISDENYLYLVGDTKSYGNGNRDGFILKYNIEDKRTIFNTWGRSDYDEFHCIDKTDGSLIIGGFSFWREGKSIQCIIAKMNQNLQFEWVNDYGNSSSQYAYSIKNMSSGGIYLGGVDRSVTLYAPWLIKVDNNGILAWEKIYADYSPGYLVDICEIDDSKCILLNSIGGFFNPSTIWHMGFNSNADISLVEIDQNGNILKDTVFCLPYHDIPVKIMRTGDNNYLVLSHSQSINPGNSFDICLSLISEDFDILWMKGYGGTGFEYAADMEIDNDGNINIVGTSASSDKGFPVLYFIKTDIEGNLIYENFVYSYYRSYASGIEIIDGKLYLSATVTIDNDDNFLIVGEDGSIDSVFLTSELYFYPNPVTDYCSIGYRSRNENNTDLVIKIFNLTGQIVFERKYLMEELINVVQIDLTGFSPGQYFFQADGDSYLQIMKFIVVN